MDIVKKLKDLQNGTESADNVIKQLVEEKRQIEKNMHIIDVLNTAQEIQKMISNQKFKDSNIDEIEIFYEADYELGYFFNITLIHSKNNNEKEASSNRVLEALIDYFDTFRGFNNHYIDSSFTSKKVIRFKMDDTFKDKFVNIMLNEELKKLLNYSVLENKIVEKEERNSTIKI